MDSAAEERKAGSGAEEEEVEEVEEVEEEVEEEEEEVEEEDVDEEEEGGGGGGEGGFQEQGVDNVDSAGQELKHSVSGSSSEGKIFVGGVAWDTTEDTFTNHFKKYGDITDSVIMKDKHTKTPRGFGFITFADPPVIEKVLEDEHVIDGRTVEVKRTVPRESMSSKGGPKIKKIFVGGIPTSLTEDEFKEYFSSYGEVVESQIMLDHATGRSRGFGFVTFEDEESVEQVISQGKMHELGGKQVEIKKAVPKKSGGEPGISGRPGYGPGGGNVYGAVGGGAFGYGGGYRSGGAYGGRMAGGGYGRGYGYGGGFGYGMGYGAGYGGPMYGGAGYGGADGYGSPGGYGGAYGAGYGGGGGRYGGGRYHPYGR